MATVDAVRVFSPNEGGDQRSYVWRSVANGDTINPLDTPSSPVGVQFRKGSAFGGSMSLTGTLIPPIESTRTFHTLNALDGTSISAVTADALYDIRQDVESVQPVAGAGVSGVDVWIFTR